MISSDTLGPYCLSIASSDSMLGLSIAWVEKRSPREPKKSLPRKGKPGLKYRVTVFLERK